MKGQIFCWSQGSSESETAFWGIYPLLCRRGCSHSSFLRGAPRPKVGCRKLLRTRASALVCFIANNVLNYGTRDTQQHSPTFCHRRLRIKKLLNTFLCIQEVCRGDVQSLFHQDIKSIFCHHKSRRALMFSVLHPAHFSSNCRWGEMQNDSKLHF